MIVLYGAGTTGRLIVRSLREQGKPLPVLVDSNPAKWGQVMEGVEVIDPSAAQGLYPDATWIASIIVPSMHKEVVDEIERLGVKTMPVWGFLPQRNAPLPESAKDSLLCIANPDADTWNFLWDQIHFRDDPENYRQMPYANIADIYFPEFIVRREDEHYVDCGAADGDTVREFRKRWPAYRHITAFEPDPRNRAACQQSLTGVHSLNMYELAITDHDGFVDYCFTGDYSAHIGTGDGGNVKCAKLDSLPQRVPPTYIKMDIVGAELEALWGARRILKEHSPVLAICAYHTSDHLWQIPLLIHAIQPNYRLYFRRYAEGSLETVWYAVPLSRETAPR